MNNVAKIAVGVASLGLAAGSLVVSERINYRSMNGRPDPGELPAPVTLALSGALMLGVSAATVLLTNRTGGSFNHPLTWAALPLGGIATGIFYGTGVALGRGLWRELSDDC